MNLLELLGLAHKAQAQQQYARPQVTPGDEPNVAAASDLSPNMQAIDAQLGNRMPSPDNPTVVGHDTGFHSRKASLLAILGDAMLVHGGFKPMFSQNRQNEDYRRAMQDYATDPLGAIKNLSQLKGHEGEVQRLKNQLDDNRRADLVAQGVAEDRREKGRNVLRSMMGSVKDQATYEKLLPTMQKYAEARDIDPSELPSTYDPDAINAYRMGGVTVDQQIDDSRQERNSQVLQDYRAQTLGIRRQEVGNQTRNVNSEVANRNSLMTKRNRTAPADFAKLRANKVMRTKNGLAEFDPTGTKMKVTAKNGKVFYYGIDPKTDKPVYMGTNYGVNAKTGKILPVNPDDEDE